MECWGTLTFTNEVATALTAVVITSQDQNKTESFNIPPGKRQNLMRLHSFLRIHRQLMIAGGGRDIFFSGIATGTVPIML